MKPTFLKTSDAQYVNLNEIRWATITGETISLGLSNSQVVKSPRFRLANLERFVSERYNTVAITSKGVSKHNRTKRSRRSSSDIATALDVETEAGRLLVFPKGLIGLTLQSGNLLIAVHGSTTVHTAGYLFKLEEAQNLFRQLGLILSTE